MEQATRIRHQLKSLILFYMAGIALSGITAFPMVTELNMLNDWFQRNFPSTLLADWIVKVEHGVSVTNENFPFIFYGTDWLAFAHIVIAMLFIGVLRDPVRNIWIVEWSMLTSLCVFPLAFIAGPIREIPLLHQVIDSLFGIAGFTLGFIIRKKILLLQNDLERQNQKAI
jgi:hypothetical protein